MAIMKKKKITIHTTHAKIKKFWGEKKIHFKASVWAGRDSTKTRAEKKKFFYNRKTPTF